MRDPQRINRILGKISEVWKSNPDLRLCQLIGNCFSSGDNYHREDEELEKKLGVLYKRSDYCTCGNEPPHLKAMCIFENPAAPLFKRRESS